MNRFSKLVALAAMLLPAASHFLKKFWLLSGVMFMIVFILIIISFFTGCATPRTNSIFKLNFSDQAPTALMKIECNGTDNIVQGIFACEEKEPKKSKIQVKIMPVEGQLIYSDGLTKKVEDFNWGEKGFWFWKKKEIKDTWVDLDPVELKSIYGDVPIAFNVTGKDEKVGVIVNRGIIYNRWCNDRDIPCSKLIVSYDCAGSVKNTWKGQLGYCSRMSGSSQKFSIPIKSLDYQIPEGARLLIRSGRTGWTMTRDITSNDIDFGEIKIIMPQVLNGPDLVSFRVIYKDQEVPTNLDTHILISGYNPKWTGLDNPHWLEKKSYNSSNRNGFEYGGGVTWYMPVMSDLMEVYDYSRRDKEREIVHKKSGETKTPKSVSCAYAWQRSSGALSYTCLDKNLTEVNHP